MGDQDVSSPSRHRTRTTTRWKSRFAEAAGSAPVASAYCFSTDILPVGNVEVDSEKGGAERIMRRFAVVFERPNQIGVGIYEARL